MVKSRVKTGAGGCRAWCWAGQGCSWRTGSAFVAEVAPGLLLLSSGLPSRAAALRELWRGCAGSKGGIRR